MLLPLLIACSVGGSGPATPGSTAAEELSTIERIQTRAAEIESLSGELEGLTDAARVTEDGPDREAVIVQMRELMVEITAKNEVLQADVAGLELRLHEAAGDPLLDVPTEE